MSNNELRVPITPEDGVACMACTKAIIFSVTKDRIDVEEEWANTDEVHGEGVIIQIPLRVWRIALPWIKERTDEPS